MDAGKKSAGWQGALCVSQHQVVRHRLVACKVRDSSSEAAAHEEDSTAQRDLQQPISAALTLAQGLRESQNRGH